MKTFASPHLEWEGPILVLAAHPDDEVLGCGGTIARLAEEGKEVHIAIFGEGITSRAELDKMAIEQGLQQLHSQAQQVANLLGARSCTLFDLPDNRFDSVPLLEIVHRIESLLTRLQPATLFTQSGADLNLDHVLLHRASLIATRPQTGQCVCDLFSYTVASSSEWAFGQFAPPYQPTLFVEIEPWLERKIEAMEQYESEARVFPHPRSPEALRAEAKRLGATAGLQAAEAFQLIRAIRR